MELIQAEKLNTYRFCDNVWTFMLKEVPPAFFWHIFHIKQIREGVRKKNRISYGLFTDKKIYPHFFLEIESMIAKTNFTLGPIEKFIFFVKL